MKRIHNPGRAFYVVCALLFINSFSALLTGGWTIWQSCNVNCQVWGGYLVIWGVVGLSSGVFLLRKYQWAIWSGSLFFLLQTIGLVTTEFYYLPYLLLDLHIKISSGNSMVSFNLLAIAAIMVLISVFVREAQSESE